MKFPVLVVLCAVFAVRETSGKFSVPKEIEDLLIKLSNTCEAESGVDPGIIEDMKKAKLSSDPAAKCYIKCMMMQLQAMTDDGTLDIDLIEATMPEELKQLKGMETVRKCAHIKEPDLCETAYQLILCFQKENPEITALFE